jgi:hypothetical protein
VRWGGREPQDEVAEHAGDDATDDDPELGRLREVWLLGKSEVGDEHRHGEPDTCADRDAE